jgi:(1->4)-alpha-D-glucan 1-alpha-D-glucosylmutase
METLHQLAAELGVALSYTDAFGRRCEVSPETLRAVCAALGFDARDNSATADSLQRLHMERREELAPPVVALRGTVPLEIPITIVRPHDELRIFWELHRETGETSNGSAIWRDLALIDSRPPDGAYETRALPIVPELVPGYHDVRVELADASARAAQVRIIAAPARAYQPAALQNGGRVWALATQLYSLKRDDDWGIGDFGALHELVGMAARSGAAAIGLNPPHSLFHDDPEHVSPYSPSSRQFTNPLYLDVPAIEDFGECEAARQLVHSEPFRQRLADLRGLRHVDYAGVTAAKYQTLKLLYENFRNLHLSQANDPRGEAFREFQARHGEALKRYATFSTLREHFGGGDPAMRYWRHWPEEFRRAESSAVKTFAADNIERVEYFEYLQWQSDLQMERAGLRSLSLHLPVGLYGDLAIGIDSGGADAWANQDVVVDGFSAGAPPDPWAHLGQNWGFPPLDPRALRRTGYRMFADVLRANMRHTGALRIDHVLGLRRMFFVPNGRPAAEGAYVDYPFDELLAVVILESHRNQCLVVGEDLGTLPPGIQEALQAACLYSYRLLYFERDHEGRFKRPGDYPAEAVAAVSTHDLPTLAGYWSGSDIGLRDRFGMLATPEERVKADQERTGERQGLVAAMRQEGLPVDDANDVTPRLELHRYVARTPSRLAIAQLDDAIEEPDQINVPGTHREYPNWRRRYTQTLAEIFADPRAQALFAVMREERPPLPGAPSPGGGGGRGGQAFARRHAAPVATYRMQLNASFTFKDAQATLPYLYRLGISHLYVSPFTKARPGSTHGYDVTDHNAINPEVGDEASLAQLSDALASLDMGLILDFVPNHMGIGPGNHWWLDVLEWGTASPNARYFDIDWQAHKSELAGKVLVPFLGDNYGAVLERGELALKFDAQHGTFSVWYFDTPYPIRPAHYGLIIRRALTDVPPPGGEDGDARLRAFAEAFARLRIKGTGRRRRSELREQGRALQAELATLAREPKMAEWLGAAAGTFTGTPGDPPSFRLLHQLLERQAYRLSYWRVATNEINYRRFFDVNELIGIRQEEPELFDQTHRLVGRLIVEDKIQGLRIDHVDGLFDPAGYCARLRRFIDDNVARRDGVSRKNTAAAKRRFPIYLEKILAHHESMRTEWPVDGTTGYEFLAQVNRVFLHPDGRTSIETAFRNFGGTTEKFEDILEGSKRHVMETLLASELDVLARELDHLSEQHWLSRDYTLERLRRAVVATVSQYSVYRSYVTAAGCSDNDRRIIETAINRAKRHWQGPDEEILDFLQSVLTLDLVRNRNSGYSRTETVRFAMRFQQYSSPVMAKGLEDTAGYRYPRFLSLNEVGSEPNLFELSAGAFHAVNEERRRAWPRNMLATATHDTKRGEDVRARLNVLSEMPDWGTTVRKWRRFNRRWRAETDGVRTPSFNDEYMIYQTLLGAWPPSDTFETLTDREAVATFTERVKDYVVKAVREAKTISSWSNPNEAYEQGCRNFVDAIVDERERNLFMEDFRGWTARVARLGALNSLSQIVLKCFAPGFPDTYQGDELWDLNLVDPDNRRPVDYGARARALAGHSGDGVDMEIPGALLKDWRSAEIKLYLLHQALRLRNARPDLFAEGSYEPLRVNGERSSHVVGFGRRNAEQYVLVAVGRWFVSLTGPTETAYPGAIAWQDTSIEVPPIPGGMLIDIFTGRTYVAPTGDGPFVLDVGELFATLPVAVLIVTSPPTEVRPTVGS